MSRPTAPAATRNTQPLLDVLGPKLEGRVFEVASGTGQHARAFTDADPSLVWQTTELVAEDAARIDAWREGAHPGFLAPRCCDVTQEPWSTERYDHVVAVNLVHISPFHVTRCLFSGASTVLENGGWVWLYGPFFEATVPTVESNTRFDAWLKDRDPRFGIRSREDVEQLAALHGFTLAERLRMPANNLVLGFHAGKRKAYSSS